MPQYLGLLWYIKFEQELYVHKVHDLSAAKMATGSSVSELTGCWMVPLVCVVQAGTPLSHIRL